jgi:putative DNA primase/helicase
LDRISTAELIQRLCEDEEKPWATFNRGASIRPRQIAQRLKDFSVSSYTIRLGCTTAKGYLRSQFTDVFARYLAPKRNSVTSPSLLAADVTDM